MKQKIKNLVDVLRTVEPVAKGGIKNRQIDAFFTGISELGLTVDDRVNGTIRYREVGYSDESVSFSVTVIQVDSDEQEEMFIIDTDFSDEE